MQEKGLEPSGYCYHTDLNRARLPIPPFLQIKQQCYYTLCTVECQCENYFFHISHFCLILSPFKPLPSFC